MEQKPRKSPALTAFIAMENRDAERGRKRLERSMAKWPQYPHSRRAAAFCWLWDNYDGVREVQHDHYLTWKGIACLAGLDGLKGRWGEPVTANALRRVFTRVDAEIQDLRAKEREAELGREEQERRAQSVREWKERVGRLAGR